MKLGIIGTGKIVHEALFAMEEIKEIERTAIFARPKSREKGEKLAEQYGIGKVYTDYAELYLQDRRAVKRARSWRSSTESAKFIQTMLSCLPTAALTACISDLSTARTILMQSRHCLRV